MGNCFWVLETYLKIDRHVKEKIIRFSSVYFLSKSTSQIQPGYRFKGSSLEMKNAQPAIACSKLTIETLEQGVKYVQS